MKKSYIIAVILIILLSILLIFKKDQTNYDFNIYFFDAGKADAIILSKNNKYIMIDTGEESLGNRILSYFNKNNIKKLDYLIITHFDKDHVGSASKIIDNIEIDNVLESNYPKDSIYYDNYKTSLNEKNIEPIVINNNYEINLEDIKIIVNGPDKIYDKNESNNSSLIVSVTYKDNKFLFMGDAENARIKDFLEINDENYDLIKIPHHGEYMKRLDDLFSSKKPKYAIITSSFDDAKTIDLLNKYHIKYYSTKNGSINVLASGNKIKVEE